MSMALFAWFCYSECMARIHQLFGLIVGIVALSCVAYIGLRVWDEQRMTPATDTEETAPSPDTQGQEQAQLIHIDTPQSGDRVTSPLRARGEARGQWFFEATFPLILTNWDGLIIAEGYAQAQDEWMTTDFVPFEGTLEFTSPYQAGSADFMKRGTLILQKANPSGLPEHDDARGVVIEFAPR